MANGQRSPADFRREARQRLAAGPGQPFPPITTKGADRLSLSPRAIREGNADPTNVNGDPVKTDAGQ